MGRNLYLLMNLSTMSLLLSFVFLGHSASAEEITVNIQDVQFTEITTPQGPFLKADLIGLNHNQGIHYRVGQPELPVVRFLLKQAPSSVTAGKSSKSAQLSHPIVPNQPSHAKNNETPPPFTLDKKAYMAKSSFGDKLYDVKIHGSVNGENQYLLTLYPLTYYPQSNRYTLRKQFTIRLDTPQPNKIPTNAVEKEYFVFIVPEMLQNNQQLKQYIQIKQRLGYTVETLIINQENNRPALIRKQLRTLYQTPGIKLSHALIIGDQELVAGFDSNIIRGVTDHYYRALDLNHYESDINGPDIGVGRIAVQTHAQLDQVLTKHMKYIQADFFYEDWLKKIAFLATDDLYEIAEGTHNHVIELFTAPHQYMGVFPNNPQLGGDKLYAITHKVSNQQVNQSLSAGRAIINYSGHGATTFWDAPRVTQADVRALDHFDSLPFVISNACITGDFTVDESFAETWQRHPRGAITFWGSMDNTYWYEDDVLEKQLYENIYGQNLLQFKQMTQAALSEVWKYYGGEGYSAYYWETYVTFGDPSLYLRTSKNQSVTVENTSDISKQSHNITYRLTHNKQPLVGIRVALTDPALSKAPIVGITNEQGEVNLIIPMGLDIADYMLSYYGPNIAYTSQSL